MNHNCSDVPIHSSVSDDFSPALRIQNLNSSLAYMYHMKTPFLVTLETCSGTEAEDYINFLTLSSQDAHFNCQSSQEHHMEFLKRPPHFHDYFELILVLKGSITQKIENKDYYYPAGACCMINRGLSHMEDFNSQAKVLFVGLSTDFIKEILCSSKSAYFANEKDILQSEICRFIEADIKNAGIKSYLDFIPAYKNHLFPTHLHTLTEEMLHLLLFPEFGATYRLKGLICQIIQYLSNPQYYHCTRITVDSSSDFLLFSRISHLMAERNGRISRSELEQSLNYTGDYLNRIIHKYSGMCTFDYAMTFCLKKTAEYLINTNDSISTIASRMNFSNRTHFYSLFKEHFGMTPKEFRKMHQKGGAVSADLKA
ncbi:MAG: AraC family transcriptional regulator [Eubacteriales bacterium]|nr:AraC family transcriptional regulator [Eubacteriales bacterium]